MIRRPAFLGFALLLGSGTALAQSRPAIDQRVDKVERELRAVQRKVFPGGAPAFSEPEIAPVQAPLPEAASGGSALNALSSRVDSLEREVSRLTGQIEQDEHRLSILSEATAKDRGSFDARLKALETASIAAPPTVTSAAPTMGEEAGMPFGRPSKPMAPSKAPTKGTKPAARPATDDAAIAPANSPDAAPASGDPAEDAYMAGYRLWRDKHYAEAETALKAVVAKYPKHRRASYAQNLLGRAYLDDDHPATAAEAFAANYQSNPRGERAPESLYYLGQSLMTLKKPADACRVYDELGTAYGDKVDATLKTRVTAARAEAKCK